MKRLLLLLPLLLLWSCGEKHDIVGHWKVVPEQIGTLYHFKEIGEVVISNMGLSVAAKYTFDGKDVDIDATSLPMGSFDDVKLRLNWKNKNEVEIVNANDEKPNDRLTLVRLTPDEVAKLTEGTGQFVEGQPNRKSDMCAENLRQIGMAMQMYANDNDGHYPGAFSWMDNLAVYSHTDKIFTCPIVETLRNEYGYALRSEVADKHKDKIVDPAKAEMVFDSKYLLRNAAEPGTGKPVPGRHDGKNNVVYADGHVGNTP